MALFRIEGAAVIAHLRSPIIGRDLPEDQLALTVDGQVWTRSIGGWTDPPPPVWGPSEGWVSNQRVPASQIGNWLAVRLAEGWRQISG
jgi:hypothetical protein